MPAIFAIDIYDRYQDIADLNALRNSPFDAAYVKGTDGGGTAPVAPDNFVRQLKSAGIPVGLYHYAQFSPSPEQQAAVLASHVRRLDATGLPPALDLEDPFPVSYARSRDFAQRFLVALNRLGFPQVVLYANTSMLNAIRAWELDDVLKPLGGDVLVWAADYGGNDADYDDEDRQRLARRYPHPVWMHQYSSTGPVPGIPGNVDKNWMFHQPSGDDDMATPRETWEDYRVQVLSREGAPVVDAQGNPYKTSPQEMLAQNNRVGWANAADLAALLKLVGTISGQLSGLTEAVKQLAGGGDADLAAIEEAAARGAQRGVEQATVNVDIDISGQPLASRDTPEQDTPTPTA